MTARQEYHVNLEKFVRLYKEPPLISKNIRKDQRKRLREIIANRKAESCKIGKIIKRRFVETLAEANNSEKRNDVQQS
jgi:hypothetical protein